MRSCGDKLAGSVVVWLDGMGVMAAIRRAKARSRTRAPTKDGKEGEAKAL